MHRIFFLFLCLIPSTCLSVSVSTYRIYLDRENNVSDYWVSNKSLVNQSCELDFTHYTFDASGNLAKYEPEDFIPANSAEPIVRFSPRRFTIAPKTKQKIRFSLRNKRDINAVEYRSHVIISCKDIKNDNNSNMNVKKDFAAVTVKPILRHHIPLVVRPRKLNAELEIKNINLHNNTLIFDLVRSGERSVYGQVNIKDQNDNLITSSRKFPLYHEVLSQNVSISLPEFAASALVVEFVEENELNEPITSLARFEIK